MIQVKGALPKPREGVHALSARFVPAKLRAAAGFTRAFASSWTEFDPRNSYSLTLVRLRIRNRSTSASVGIDA
jgi:hypothetical protein